MLIEEQGIVLLEHLLASNIETSVATICVQILRIVEHDLFANCHDKQSTQQQQVIV